VEMPQLPQPISTRTHAMIDYLTIGTLLTLPRVLGWSERLTEAVTTVALSKLGYTLLTRHEGGAAKVLPMKAHLAMDAVGGASLAALPWVLEEEDDVAKVMCAAIGAMDVMVAPMTQSQSPQDNGRRSGNGNGSRRRRPAVSKKSRQRQPSIPSPT